MRSHTYWTLAKLTLAALLVAAPAAPADNPFGVWWRGGPNAAPHYGSDADGMAPCFVGIGPLWGRFVSETHADEEIRRIRAWHKQFIAPMGKPDSG